MTTTEDHDFLPVNGHPDDDECTHRADGTDATYCGEPRAAHDHSAETTTEWGVHDFGGIQKCPDEQNARDRIAACRGRTLVRREVTSWTEVDR